MTYDHPRALASTGKHSIYVEACHDSEKVEKRGVVERVGHGPTSLRARRHRALPKIRRLPYKLNRLFLSRGVASRVQLQRNI